MSYGQLEIHEFSTGITPDGTRDSWVSKGFTGGYMNCTGEIPHAVKRAIANDWFKVISNCNISDLTIVGHVVENLAVVAVVNQGRDDTGRPLTAYRYFWAEGEESLSKIVAWINFEVSQGRKPSFNPFEVRTSPTLSEVPAANFDEVAVSELIEANTVTPLIFDPNGCNLSLIDFIAHKKVELSEQSASWAYNVRALEKPELFQVILPIDEKALEIVKRTLATKPEEDSRMIDEQALITAIKVLADRATIKIEHWQTFVQNIDLVDECFEDRSKSKNYWNKLFNGQGAANAIKQGIYTEDKVRLLTLRAFILPDTLLDFLMWLKVGAKDDEYVNISLKFQEQVLSLNELDDLKELLIKGGRNLIEDVFNKDVSVKAAVPFLIDPRSIWANYRLQYAKDLKNDMQVLNEQQVYWQKAQPAYNFSFSEGMQQYWQLYKIQPNKNYAVLAGLFFELKDYQLAACFHQLSYGNIPKTLFNKAFPGYLGSAQFNGLKIKQKGFCNQWRKDIVPIKYAAPITLVIFLAILVGFLIKSLFFSNMNTNSQSSTSNPRKLKDTYDESVAITEFSKPRKTEESLNSIFKEINIKDECNISKLLNNVLGTTTPLNIKYTNQKIKIDDRNNKAILVKAIYDYQVKNNQPKKDGIVDSIERKPTFTQLKEDLNRQGFDANCKK